MIKRLSLITIIICCYCLSGYGQITFSYESPEPFTVGKSITELSPTVLSGSASTYTISPALPAGLRFDNTKGTISGMPGVISPQTTYTVIAVNGVNRGTTTLKISVRPAVPYISYNPIDYSFNLGRTIPLMLPANQGGIADGYTVNPALPAGLTLNTTSGEISGAPTAVSSPALYTVTAKNASGSSGFNIKIRVMNASPGISYTSTNTFITGVRLPDLETNLKRKNRDAITEVYRNTGLPIPSLLPTISGESPINYSVNPALPAGIALNTTTGEITGMADSVSLLTKYTITATYKEYLPSSFDMYIAVIANPGIPIIPASIRFVGEGSIQKSLSSGSKIPANTGIGIVYREGSSRRYGILHDLEVDFSVNVASTVDTIKSINDPSTNAVTNKSDFGNSVLLPLNSGQAFSFSMKGYLTEKGGKNGNYQRNQAPIPLAGFISGFNVSIVGSNRNWQYDSNDGTSTLVKASQLSLFAGPFYEFITPKKKNNYGQNASVTLGVGYSGRWILGNVRQDTQGDLRNNLLGSTAKSFNGAEVILGLRFYNIKAEVHLPFLSRKTNIPGLSGAQPSTFIGFTGGFPIDLTKTID